MKILASDFDGTLSRDDGVTEQDLLAIERFREAGNKFGLVTGRSYVLVQPELRSYPRLKPDFMVLSTGGAIADSTGKLIYEKTFDMPVVHRLIDKLYELDTMHFGCSDMYANYIFRLADDLNYPEFLDAIGPLDSTPDAILARGRIEAFVAYDTDAARSVEIMGILEREFAGEIACHLNASSIDITPYGVSKSTGVEFIEKYYGAPANVIGDERNDLVMLRDFESFAVDTGCEDAKRAATYVVSSVAEAIDMLMKK